MPRLLPRRGRVGVLELRGIIGGGPRLGAYVELLRALGESAAIRAVILDIDSPGGSASASDALRLAVERVRQRKPVLAYIRSLGASGAYLVCCAASRVMALPTGLVGSIGVISYRPQLAELMERWGARVSVSKAGRLKDMGAFWREETEEERQVEQALVDEYYNHFVDTVAAARRLLRERALEVATGEVFTGHRAVALGLVDGVGDWESAVRTAMEMGSVTRRRLVYARPRRSLAARLLGRFSGEPGVIQTLGARVLYLDVRSVGEYL